MIPYHQLWCILPALILAALVSCDSQSLVETDTKEQTDSKPNLEQIAKLRGNVTFKLEDGSGYTGTLDNDPYSTNKIKAGFEISFEPRHVIDIFDD